MNILIWSSSGDLSSGSNLGIHFYGFLGSLYCSLGMNTLPWSNQGLLSWSIIGIYFEEEGIEHVLLSQDSWDGDEDEEGGVGGGPHDTMLGCGLWWSLYVSSNNGLIWI